MKFAACLFLVTAAAASLQAQTFLPAMPPGVPEVTGDVQEAAVFRYIEIVKGTGAPAKPGQRYIAHYTGWLRDGTKFDSSVDRKQPFDFVQGRRMVIAGWEMGFEGMNAGGKRRLFVPYQLAYGEKGNGPIPPKAELIFDIELLESKDVPEYVAAADILDPFDEYRDKVLALASAIPAEKYGWRTAPDVRSVAEVLTHIALGVKLMNDLGIQEPAKEALEKRQAEMLAMEKQPRSKDEIVALLKTTFEEVRKTIVPLRAGILAREIRFYGQNTTRRGSLIFLNTHLAEHLGQMIAYARANGIVPPWAGK